jgi:electron transport complex protein RnfG
MNEQSSKKTPGMAKLVLVLFVICVITSLLLGMVNYITEGPIAESKAEKTSAAMQAVMPADEYTEDTYPGSDPLVQSVSRAMSGGTQVGWVIGVSPSGFGGAIDMVVGVDMNGLVTGISIVKMSETSGLGTNANKDGLKTSLSAGRRACRK